MFSSYPSGLLHKSVIQRSCLKCYLTPYYRTVINAIVIQGKSYFKPEVFIEMRVQFSMTEIPR